MAKRKRVKGMAWERGEMPPTPADAKQPRVYSVVKLDPSCPTATDPSARLNMSNITLQSEFWYKSYEAAASLCAAVQYGLILDFLNRPGLVRVADRLTAATDISLWRTGSFWKASMEEGAVVKERYTGGTPTAKEYLHLCELMERYAPSHNVPAGTRVVFADPGEPFLDGLQELDAALRRKLKRVPTYEVKSRFVYYGESGPETEPIQ